MACEKITWKSVLSSCFTPKNCIKKDPTRKIVPNPNTPTRLSVSDISSSAGTEMSSSEISASLLGLNLQVFGLDELRVITNNFSYTSNFLGEGGFGAVYKGFIDGKVLRPGSEAQAVAVKVLDLEGSQGHKEWLAEVIFLGQLRHPNLVKLIGYCCENDQRVLVYEYMAKGNLENHLFRRHSDTLPWLTRIKIAVGAAKGLAFLHEVKEPVIFRDFKAANILLDADYKAKLSDFGFARDGPEEDKTHVTTKHILGTKGYVAPEYIMSGHLTTMSDVYSFGVFLLELLTGRRSMDKTRHRREQCLVEWVRPILKDPPRIDRIMDPRLEGQYSTNGAKIAAMVAYQCLSHQPKSRPSMGIVVKTLEPLLHMKDIPSGPFVYVAPNTNPKTKIGSSKIDLQNEQKGRRIRNPAVNKILKTGQIHLNTAGEEIHYL